MNDPTPLLESSDSTTTRALLRSGLGDAPPPEALRRLTAVLGVTAGAAAMALPAAATTNATLNAAAVAAAGVGNQAAGTSALVLGKWLLAGLAGGALVSGTASIVERVQASRPSNAAVAAVHARPETRAPAPRSAIGAPAESAVTAADSAAPVRVSAADTTRAATRAPTLAPGVATAAETETSRALGSEARRIDAARRALASGDARRAIAELDAYRRATVDGVLEREAAVLRIRVLLSNGEGARAAALAREYLERYPRDAYQAELEAVLANAHAGVSTREGIDRPERGHSRGTR